MRYQRYCFNILRATLVVAPCDDLANCSRSYLVVIIIDDTNLHIDPGNSCGGKTALGNRIVIGGVREFFHAQRKDTVMLARGNGYIAPDS